MITFQALHENITLEHLGLIPLFISNDDPRSAVEQIDENYQHGGGWKDLGVIDVHVEYDKRKILQSIGYEGEPMRSYAKATHMVAQNGEKFAEEIYICEYSMVVVVDLRNGSFRWSRID